MSERETIEVVGEDMMCFKVDAVTLDPISSSSYYEPAAWNDPRGKQMSVGRWSALRYEQRDKQMRRQFGRPDQR